MYRKTHRIAIGSVAAGLISLAPAASALDFQIGDIEARINSEIAWGAQWSVQDADERYLYSGRSAALPGGPTAGNGGNNPSPNDDNGRLNFNTGLISNQVKFRSEIGLQWGEFGSRTEVLALHDFYLKDHSRRRTQPSKESDREIASDVRLLENYVYWDGFVDDRMATVRVGDQSIVWGEANLILGTNSYINPVDFNRVLSPTFDREELYRPIGAAYGSISVLPNLVLDAYIQYDWEPHQIPPGGSFYANTDYVGAGPRESGEGFLCIDSASPTDRNGATDVCGTLASPQNGGQDGQWGVRATWTIEQLNFTNLSLYYMNYHARIPHVNILASGEVRNFLGAGADDPTLANGITNLRYNEDIEVWGASFNTNAAGGISLAGEVTLRKDYPVQLNRTVLLCAAGQIGNLFLVGAPGLGTGTALQDVPVLGAASCANRGFRQLPSATQGQQVDGFRALDVVQAQVSAAKTFNQVLGGDTMLAFLEVGYLKVVDMPTPSELKFEKVDASESGAADSFGWGYRVLLANEYNNVIPGLQSILRPALVFAHDVNGYTPKNLASFQEEKKQASVGLNLEVLNRYSMGINYVTFFGGKDSNFLADRDNISVSFSMDF